MKDFSLRWQLWREAPGWVLRVLRVLMAASPSLPALRRLVTCGTHVQLEEQRDPDIFLASLLVKIQIQNVLFTITQDRYILLLFRTWVDSFIPLSFFIV